MSPRLARPVRLKIYSRVAGWGEEAFPIHSLKMKRGANGRFSPYLQVCFIILLVHRVGVRQYVRIKYSKKAFSSFRIFPFFRTIYGTVRTSTGRWQSDKQKKGTANQPGRLACVEKDRSIPYQLLPHRPPGDSLLWIRTSELLKRHCFCHNTIPKTCHLIYSNLGDKAPQN